MAAARPPKCGHYVRSKTKRCSILLNNTAKNGGLQGLYAPGQIRAHLANNLQLCPAAELPIPAGRPADRCRQRKHKPGFSAGVRHATTPTHSQSKSQRRIPYESGASSQVSNHQRDKRAESPTQVHRISQLLVSSRMLWE